MSAGVQCRRACAGARTLEVAAGEAAKDAAGGTVAVIRDVAPAAMDFERLVHRAAVDTTAPRVLKAPSGAKLQRTHVAARTANKAAKPLRAAAAPDMADGTALLAASILGASRGAVAAAPAHLPPQSSTTPQTSTSDSPLGCRTPDAAPASKRPLDWKALLKAKRQQHAKPAGALPAAPPATLSGPRRAEAPARADDAWAAATSTDCHAGSAKDQKRKKGTVDDIMGMLLGDDR